MDLEMFIVMQVFALCAVVGYLIKYHMPKVNKNKIPLIVSLLGVILNVWINKWQVSPEIILMGLVSGLSSTGAYELIKHTLNLPKEIDGTIEVTTGEEIDNYMLILDDLSNLESEDYVRFKISRK